jgi:hypothetical protein
MVMECFTIKERTVQHPPDSALTDSSLPAVGLPLDGPESRLQLWNKAKLTYKYVHANFLKDYDWFFKADDDT